MSVQRRSLFGPANEPPSRGPEFSTLDPSDYVAPVDTRWPSPTGITDQASPQTADERRGLTTAFRQSQTRSSGVADDGSQGSAGVALRSDSVS